MRKIAVILTATLVHSWAAFASPLEASISVRHLVKGPEVQGEESVVKIVRNGRALQPLATLEGQISSKINELSVYEDEKIVAIPTVVCDTFPGIGDGNWMGFFEASGIEDRAHKLSMAIAGLNYQQAVGLLEAGRFQARPKNWAEFSKEIEDYSASYPHAYLVYNVLSLHGDENIKNLNYSNSEVCRLGVRTEKTSVVHEEKKYLKTVTKKFKINLRDALLDLGETETVVVTMVGEELTVYIHSLNNVYKVISRADVNHYTEGHSVIFEIQGTRVMRSPVNTIVTTLHNQHGDLIVDLDDTAFYPGRAGSSVVHVTVYEYTGGWMNWLSFGLFGNKEIKTFAIVLPPDYGHMKIDTGVRLEDISGKNQWVYVSYQLRRLDNPLYSDGLSNSKSTSWLKF